MSDTTHHLTPSEEKSMEDERDTLRATGDLMQSSLSRVLEWVEGLEADPAHPMPYEVAMACIEGRSSVDLWTETRRTAR